MVVAPAVPTKSVAVSGFVRAAIVIVLEVFSVSVFLTMLGAIVVAIFVTPLVGFAIAPARILVTMSAIPVTIILIMLGLIMRNLRYSGKRQSTCQSQGCGKQTAVKSHNSPHLS
jgi:membrane protein implicated in regulation of membrane protease activity